MPNDEQLTTAMLERTAAIRIILYLYKNVDRPNGVYLTELIRGIKASSDTIMLTMNTLLKNGLIKDYYEESHPYKRIFNLTELGLSVAKPLAAVDRALRSQVSKSNH
jgi:DNA-binding HxlR family transcriptional regulator